LLSISHPGVAAELASSSEGADGPGVRTLAYRNLAAVYPAIVRAYQLGVSLPDAPLQVFLKATAGLRRTTKAERLSIERIGQDVFRKSQLAYSNNRCSMTGVTEPTLLRASHIVPWAECDDDATGSTSTTASCSQPCGTPPSTPARSASPTTAPSSSIHSSAQPSAPCSSPRPHPNWPAFRRDI